MNRRQLLAAETFAYSYANYADHLGGNIRFDRWMPESVDTLERDVQEGWEDARLAEALEVGEDRVEHWRRAYRRAKDIVDAPHPRRVLSVGRSLLDPGRCRRRSDGRRSD